MKSTKSRTMQASLRVAFVLTVFLIGHSLQAPAAEHGPDEEINSIDKKSSVPGWFDSLLGLLDLKQTVKDFMQGRPTKSSCSACSLAMGILKSQSVEEERMGAIAYGICHDFKLSTERVCRGLIDLFQPSFAYILRHTSLSNDELCGLLLGDKCVLGQLSPSINWNIPLPPLPMNLDPVPEALHHLHGDESSPTYNVLQLSDLHVDQYYTVGSLAECKEPLCCRATSGTPATPDQAAGMWSDYRYCDCSTSFLEEVLRHISKSHKIDYILWTGDTAPHDSWNTTREAIEDDNRIISQLMKKYFNNTPVFPNIGNHEGMPVNMFPQPEITGNFSVGWLYSLLARDWSHWLDEDSRKEFQEHGAYSISVRPGLRIVSLNTNYCNRLNFWLMLNPIDAGRQLQWLVEQLYRAEQKGEKVHIIGHIAPSTDDCVWSWIRNYFAIIERFRNTVAGQFFGHTHADEYKVLYDTETHTDPIAVAYLGPSVTPYINLNPAYRIYSVDKRTQAVVDHVTYYMNLTESNERKEVLWYKAYSAKNVYNMTSLSAEEWDQLAENMKIDDDLFNQFYGYFQRFVRHPEEVCDKECRDKIICRLQTRDILGDEDCW